jgi:hypothetical protein
MVVARCSGYVGVVGSEKDTRRDALIQAGVVLSSELSLPSILQRWGGRAHR